MSLSLVVVLVLGVSVFVLAHGQTRINNRDQDNYYNQLRLSEQQIDTVEELKDDYYDRVDDLKEQLWAKQEDLRNAYIDKDVKKKKIVEIHDQINKLRQNLFKLNQQQRLKLRDMLTSSQLENMRKYGRGFYCGGFGHGYGRRGHMNFGPGMRRQGPGHHGPGMMNGF